LAFDDAIDVASPILIRSERLDDAILIGCAKTKSQEHLLAISRRKALAEPVTDVLVERGDKQVVLSTVKNSGAKFSNKGFEILVKRSDGDDLLARCVGTRPDIPPHLFQQLLEIASETVRGKLEAENPSARHEIKRAVVDVTTRIQNQATIQAPKHATAQVLVETLNLSGQLDPARLDSFASAGQLEETIAALALMADVPVDIVERKMNDEHAEFLLVLTKAAGLSWATTKAILELRAEKMLRPPNEIEQCFKSFHRLSRPTALQILGFHRAREFPGTKRPH
jgi:uncharacterized protein (DUF2336 family)